MGEKLQLTSGLDNIFTESDNFFWRISGLLRESGFLEQTATGGCFLVKMCIADCTTFLKQRQGCRTVEQKIARINHSRKMPSFEHYFPGESGVTHAHHDRMLVFFFAFSSDTVHWPEGSPTKGGPKVRICSWFGICNDIRDLPLLYICEQRKHWTWKATIIVLPSFITPERTFTSLWWKSNVKELSAWAEVVQSRAVSSVSLLLAHNKSLLPFARSQPPAHLHVDFFQTRTTNTSSWSAWYLENRENQFSLSYEMQQLVW